jgi:segregation and condensation protein A
MSINIQLPKFEGPLGLLLYLIRKEEMDIMDIKIHEITKQYFEYIKLMKELDLEVAGEFVAMASTLIHIKSRMLLPQYDENGEIVENEDPRKELVQKLLEYQKYQEAAKLLYDRPLLGRDLWGRGVRETLAPKEDEIILEDNALFS